jgi:hypothetical protein
MAVPLSRQHQHPPQLTPRMALLAALFVAGRITASHAKADVVVRIARPEKTAKRGSPCRRCPRPRPGTPNGFASALKKKGALPPALRPVDHRSGCLSSYPNNSGERRPNGQALSDSCQAHGAGLISPRLIDAPLRLAGWPVAPSLASSARASRSQPSAHAIGMMAPPMSAPTTAPTAAPTKV